jgi:hypothetical protein
MDTVERGVGRLDEQDGQDKNRHLPNGEMLKFNIL